LLDFIPSPPPPPPSQATMLDINLFRTDKGGNPDLIRESQRSRFASVELVDEAIALDKAWRESKCLLSSLPCPLHPVPPPSNLFQIPRPVSDSHGFSSLLQGSSSWTRSGRSSTLPARRSASSKPYVPCRISN
jgi:hypothetical protein